MTESITQWITQAKNFLWSGPLLVLLVSIGLFLTYLLKAPQIRYLFHALKITIIPQKKSEADKRKEVMAGDISSFQALMTALAGSVGTGNITGIAVAVSIGGLGSLVWMWLVGLIGMVTAYSECLLAIKYRVRGENGLVSGGPMVTLERGLGMKKTAWTFAFLGVVASLGVGGMVQSNSVALALHESLDVTPWMSGVGLAILTGLVLLGGVQSIGRVASILVPLMAGGYILAGLGIILYHWDQIPVAIELIFTSAFKGTAAVGGAAGIGVMSAVEQGVANGIFANEAGVGSLAIASAAAHTNKPAKQGMMAITGVFMATMVICTITGLVLAVTQMAQKASMLEGIISGSNLTLIAFQQTHWILGLVVVFGLLFFAFTTVLAWGYYGEKCLEYLLGQKASFIFRPLYILAVYFGSIFGLELVWSTANLANGLMTIPNLLSLFGLSSVIKSETVEYIKDLRKNMRS